VGLARIVARLLARSLNVSGALTSDTEIGKHHGGGAMLEARARSLACESATRFEGEHTPGLSIHYTPCLRTCDLAAQLR
jgi:hypothetical protein